MRAIQFSDYSSSSPGWVARGEWNRNETKTSLNPEKQLQSTQLSMWILGGIRIQPSSGLCSSCPHPGSCVPLIWIPTFWIKWILLTKGSSSAAIAICRHLSDFWFKSCNAEENFKIIWYNSCFMWTYFESHKRNLGEAGVAASNHSHQEYKKNTKSISFHLSCSPFYIFLIVDLKGNTEPAEKFKPFFWSHTAMSQGTSAADISLLQEPDFDFDL